MSLARRMLASGGIRLVALPLTGLASLTAQSLVIHDVGAFRFGVISLVATLPLLMPFADLGLSAAVTNAFASKSSEALELCRVAWSILIAVATTFISIVLV